MKKLLTTLFCIFTISACAFVVSCNFVMDPTPPQSGTDNTPTTPVAVIYAQAQELGYEGSLEEFLALVQGEDGKDERLEM